jgi:hypothetical protein
MPPAANAGEDPNKRRAKITTVLDIKTPLKSARIGRVTTQPSQTERIGLAQTNINLNEFRALINKFFVYTTPRYLRPTHKIKANSTKPRTIPNTIATGETPWLMPTNMTATGPTNFSRAQKIPLRTPDLNSPAPKTLIANLSRLTAERQNAPTPTQNPGEICSGKNLMASTHAKKAMTTNFAPAEALNFQSVGIILIIFAS